MIRWAAAGETLNSGVSRRIGVSLGTVRRSMAALMERLGARSRFETGLRATQRGWG